MQMMLRLAKWNVPKSWNAKHSYEAVPVLKAFPFEEKVSALPTDEVFICVDYEAFLGGEGEPFMVDEGNRCVPKKRDAEDVIPYKKAIGAIY